MKTLQAYFINQDIQMYDDDNDIPCIPKAWNLSDDLGQIDYVFSDKTGTLTRNVMVFRKCFVGQETYGETDDDAMGESLPIMQSQLALLPINPYRGDQVTFLDKRICTDLAKTSTEADELRLFFTHLATCHTVLCEKPEDHESLSSSDSDGRKSPFFRQPLQAVQTTFNSLKRRLITPPAQAHKKMGDDAVALAPIEVDHDNPFHLNYKAQSPDEEALVRAARDLGFVFLGRENEVIRVRILGHEEKFLILNVLEFTSDRKRMSVILRDPAGRLRLFCKGADSVIFERLAEGQHARKARMGSSLDGYAAEGLRTLCLAYRDLQEDEYSAWLKRYDAASALLVDREIEMENAASGIETDLRLLGVTAIEDKLQEGVPESIEGLLKAGIKVWVLTGDKVETAINIGMSCNLLGSGMALIVIKSTTVEDTRQQIHDALRRFLPGSSDALHASAASLSETSQVDSTGSLLDTLDERMRAISESGTMERHLKRCRVGNQFGLVIDGSSLKFALQDDVKRDFLDLATRCKSVMCCRVSPLQKAEVVKLVKEGLGVMALAIGDGANDVSMIQVELSSLCAFSPF